MLDKLKFDSFSTFASSVQNTVQDNKKAVAVAAGASTAALAGLYLARKAANAVPKTGSYGFGTLPVDAYDAVVVGAGPSGSVCSYYLSKNGAKVALLEKETFPRDKYCGDAVCTPAIRILEDMGVLAELKANNEAHFADAGGFVSPNGISYIGASKEKLGEAACCAVKRINLDMRCAKAAQRKGADLKEQFEVSTATFDKATGLWTVTSAKGDEVGGCQGGGGVNAARSACTQCKHAPAAAFSRLQLQRCPDLEFALLGSHLTLPAQAPFQLPPICRQCHMTAGAPQHQCTPRWLCPVLKV